jgi:hypothetical protein
MPFCFRENPRFQNKSSKNYFLELIPPFFSSSKPEQKFQTPSKEMNIMETCSNQKKASKMMKNL